MSRPELLGQYVDLMAKDFADRLDREMLKAGRYENLEYLDYINRDDPGISGFYELQPGGKDHSTVIHSVNKIEGLINTDEGLTSDIEEIKKTLMF